MIRRIFMLTIDMNVLRPHKIAVGRDLLKDCGKYIKWGAWFMAQCLS